MDAPESGQRGASDMVQPHFLGPLEVDARAADAEEIGTSLGTPRTRPLCVCAWPCGVDDVDRAVLPRAGTPGAGADDVPRAASRACGAHVPRPIASIGLCPPCI